MVSPMRIREKLFVAKRQVLLHALEAVCVNEGGVKSWGDTALERDVPSVEGVRKQGAEGRETKRFALSGNQPLLRHPLQERTKRLFLLGSQGKGVLDTGSKYWVCDKVSLTASSLAHIAKRHGERPAATLYLVL